MLGPAVFGKVLSYLDLSSILALRAVCRRFWNFTASSRIRLEASRDFCGEEPTLDIARIVRVCTRFSTQIEYLDLQCHYSIDTWSPQLPLIAIFKLKTLKTLKIPLNLSGEDLGTVLRSFPPEGGAMDTLTTLVIQWPIEEVEEDNQAHLFAFLALFPNLRKFTARGMTINKTALPRLRRCFPHLKHLDIGTLLDGPLGIQHLSLHFASLTYLRLSSVGRLAGSITDGKYGLRFLLEHLHELRALILAGVDGLSGSKHFPDKHEALSTLTLVCCSDLTDLKELFEKCPNLARLESAPLAIPKRSKRFLTDAQRAMIYDKMRPLLCTGT